jgi:hypothetical protein
MRNERKRQDAIGIGGGDENIVCKFAPYRICYNINQQGKLIPMRRAAQPVNIMRVYKRNSGGGK